MRQQSESSISKLRLAVIAAVVLCLVAGVASASSVSVQDTNPAFGTYGARFALASACTTMNEVSVTDPSGTVEACSKLTADGTVSSATTLRAGQTVVLSDGFSVTGGTSLAIEIDAALDGNAYLQDDSPNDETTYAARFYLDPSNLSFSNPGSGDQFEHFVALDSAGDPVFKLGVKTAAGPAITVFLEAFGDDKMIAATSENGNELILPTGAFQWVEVGWTASSGPGNDDGAAYVCVNGIEMGDCVSDLVFGNLDTDTRTVDSVRWGVIDVNNQLGGQVDVDQFESQRATLIGGYVAP